MPFWGRIFGKPQADRIDHPFRGETELPVQLKMPICTYRAVAHGVEQHFAVALIGLPRYWATIPQATEGPPILWNFCVVCLSSPISREYSFT